jgi:UDP-2,3-diacylglucosamine hydrolase
MSPRHRSSSSTQLSLTRTNHIHVQKRETLFISDLHLTVARPETVSRFLSFLSNRAFEAERLFILGDLFDAYLGDDDRSSPYTQIRAHLRRLVDEGTQVFFQAGNRDFLIGKDFSDETGVTLLGDYAVVDLYGTSTLLTHGDLLCTDDVGYQAARLRVRTPEWRNYALSKPLWLRRLYARWYRFKSGRDKGGKSLEIMDANADAIQQAIQTYHVSRLIHGHTHRPGFHQIHTDTGFVERLVLPEWNGEEWLLVIDESGARREPMSPVAASAKVGWTLPHSEFDI